MELELKIRKIDMPWDCCSCCSPCPWWDCAPPTMTTPIMQPTPATTPNAPAHAPCNAPLDPPVYALPTSRGRPHPPEMQRYLLREQAVHKQLRKYENDRKAEDVAKT